MPPPLDFLAAIKNITQKNWNVKFFLTFFALFALFLRFFAFCYKTQKGMLSYEKNRSYRRNGC
ncbi:MAG: hypothetical protein Pg6C_13630 [Treponemataceae bacterium]|nr:MAG: hypothetical protein Pg6C_13630 [Treponemataceae bacterium]